MINICMFASGSSSGIVVVRVGRSDLVRILCHDLMYSKIILVFHDKPTNGLCWYGLWSRYRRGGDLM